MDDLPADALARVYVNGEALAGRSPPTGLAPLPFDLAGGDAARSARRSSPRTTASGSRAGPSRPSEAEAPSRRPYESELVEEVPAACSRSSPSTTSAPPSSE